MTDSMDREMDDLDAVQDMEDAESSDTLDSFFQRFTFKGLGADTAVKLRRRYCLLSFTEFDVITEAQRVRFNLKSQALER